MNAYSMLKTAYVCRVSNEAALFTYKFHSQICAWKFGQSLWGVKDESACSRLAFSKHSSNDFRSSLLSNFFLTEYHAFQISPLVFNTIKLIFPCFFFTIAPPSCHLFMHSRWFLNCPFLFLFFSPRPFCHLAMRSCLFQCFHFMLF